MTSWPVTLLADACDAVLATVIALMRAAANWDSFQRMLNRAFPKKRKNIPLALEDE